METERRNILFGTIKVREKKIIKVIDKAVWTEGDLQYKKMDIIEVLSFKIVGQTSITKEYSEAKASNEKRNNITGAYE